jgi:pyruvate formate-lyase/glycerol dehydratase family glycyl radical enzyme
MNDRIKKLREQSLKAINKISEERAMLVTEFYKSDEARELSVPMKRALCFKHILANKYICINDDELIVGERGPEPKATPTYPEVCLHSLKDLEMLNKRPKVSYKVDDKVRKAYKEIIIPYWLGKSNRDRIMNSVTKEWLKAYNAGMFTEFMEQRAPGHTVSDGKIYKKGMLDFKAEIKTAIDSLDFYNDKDAYKKKEQLKAMEVSCDAIILFAKRHSDKLDELAKKEKDANRKQELKEIAEVCRHVPANAPRTFHEALQYYWFVHLGVITEVNPWDSFNPGRLDQHLYPFYKKEIEEGTLTKERAIELLQSFWIKFNNHPAPPKMGVTAKESNTYTDFALINLGGVKEDGSDTVNELSYILLDVIEEMRLLQPSSMVQLSKKNPESFIKRTIEITKTGFGQPSIFNTDAIVQEMIRQGKTIEDARNGGASGCVETGAFGKEAYILTGYFNLAKMVELTLYDGINPRTGEQVGINSGDVTKFKTFDEFLSAYRKQIEYFVNVKILGSNIIESNNAENLPVPFLSVIIDDCIKNGKDYNAGGARYNTNYIQGVGMGTLTDSLTAIKYHIYDKKHISMKELLKALEADFKGFEYLQHELIYQTPKYGNDNDYADENAVKVFDFFYDAVNGRPSPRGGTYRINLLPTTCHVYFGNVMDATPDGRNKEMPVSEGISPVQGADRKGPTAVINTCAKLDHIRTGGTLLNQKFTPEFLKDDDGISKVASLVRSYFRMDGHHIQFNVVNAETLRDAQKHPEKYQDLIVRVAGYSDYFNDLTPELQEEIISRTAHGEV